ncbi:MAG: hypothetical protein Q4A49_05545 [Neisseria sp.]|nr:hypothetical protein [Neisseria sp.]
METEKLYYAALMLICAVSILLSPFFYMRMLPGSRKTPPVFRPKRWPAIIVGNITAILALLAVWYFLLR